MLVRIVKMTFAPQHVNDFRKLFAERKERIAGFEGCKGVKLLNDTANPAVFFTYSIWVDAYALEKYRHSDLFAETWSTVKKWFTAAPEAWSVNEVD